MKKLIAALTTLMLVAGSAFAQISVSGDVTAGITVIQGSSADDDGYFDPFTSGGFMDGFSIEVSGEAGGGLFGGWVNLSGWGISGYLFHDDGSRGDLGLEMHAFAWWRPSRMFWLALGGNDFFARGDLGLWGFYRAAGNVGVARPGNAWGGGYGMYPLKLSYAFYDGFSDWGAMMTISPIHEIDINIGIPFISMSLFDGEDELTSELQDIVQALHAQVVFKQPWGNIALTYWGFAEEHNIGRIFVDLHLLAIDNLSLMFGFGAMLFGENHEHDHMFSVGLGAAYRISDEFGIRARALAQFGDGYFWQGHDFGLLLNVLPFFQVTPSITAFASVGLAMRSMKANAGTILDWHFNPYIEIGPEEWGPKFFAGFQLWSETPAPNANAVIRWGIPIGLQVSF